MAGETTDHSLDRDRLLLPWTPTSAIAATAAPVAIPDLAGGDSERGRTIFRGDQARCAQCHLFRGDGGKVGPDLTDIASKGRAEIYRSIAAPSATIEPDYTTYTVATTEGQVLSGVVRAEGPEEIRVTDTNARTATVRRDQIQDIRPSATSIMPPGLAGALGDSAIRDLVAYLTSPAPVPKPASP
jgi:putative heme-binding domain-containing protein